MTTTVLDAPHAAPEHPAYDERPDEFLPLIGVVPVAGPPVLLAGPLVLFALALTGPFLLILTLVVLLVACAACIAVAGAIVVTPNLLVRSLARHRPGRVRRSKPAAPLVQVGSLRRTA